jgi:hypothetical protein
LTAVTISVPITAIEEFHLARLVDDFLELIDTSRDAQDPAVERLTPTPYPGDAASTAAFADATRNDLLDRRATDARRTRASLGDFDEDPAALGDAALESRDLVIPLEELDPWLRTLTAIRLVIATRLGITADHEPGEDGRHDVYDWVGYRLELLIQAADDAGAGLMP